MSFEPVWKELSDILSLPTDDDYPIMVVSQGSARAVNYLSHLNNELCISNIAFAQVNALSKGYTHWAAIPKFTGEPWTVLQSPMLDHSFILEENNILEDNQFFVVFNEALADSEEYPGHSYDIVFSKEFLADGRAYKLGIRNWLKVDISAIMS